MNPVRHARSHLSRKQWSEIGISACLPTAVVMTTLAPQGLAWFCVVLAAIMMTTLILEMPRSGRLQVFGPIWPLIAGLLLLLAWAFGRTLASAHGLAALPILAAFGVALAASLLAGVAAYGLQPGQRWFWGFFPLVQTVAAILLGLAIMRVSQSLSPLLPAGRLDISYHYNRLALLVVLLYPLTVFAIRQMKLSRLAFWVMHTTIGTLVLFSVFRSESESAKLAFLLITTIYVLSKISIIWTRRLLITTCFVLILLFPFFFQLFLLAIEGTFIWNYNTNTFAARIVIWNEAINLVKHAPIIGNGVEVIRFQGTKDVITHVARMHHHPHSFLVQTWVDLGLIGALLMTGCIIAISRLLKPIDGEAGSMFLSLMTGVLSIWAVSHGMWQAWYVGLCGVVIAFSILAYRRSL